MMTQIPIPKHVFISYSHNDKKMVDKIIKALEEAGIPCWIDRKGIIPGTASWEAMIRDAIRVSFAVLFLASPHSGQSTVVRGELSVARSQGCPIYPLWIKGNEWTDCAPLDMIQAQYVDCRRRQRDAGVSLIIGTLKALISDYLPKHFLFTIDELNQYAIWGFENFGYGRYLFIRINDNQLVGMKMNSYASLQLLLDDLYMCYLQDRYEPYTYGINWVLRSGRVLIAPWSMLLKVTERPFFEREAVWFASSPETHLMRDYLPEGIYLNILQGSPILAMGIVTDNSTIVERLGQQKFFYSLNRILVNILENGSLGSKFRSVLPEEIDIKRYQYMFIVSIERPQLSGKVFII